MKRVLYAFPYNPITLHSGCQTRAYTLLRYFKDRGMKVDLISRQGDWERISPEGMEAIRNSGLVEKAWFWFRKPLKKNPITYFFNYKLKELLFKLKLKPVKGAVPNHVNSYSQQLFNDILQHNSYDYIIISYIYWADLIKNNPYIGQAVTILDTHDFMSSQHQRDKGFRLGPALGDEVRRLSLFDQVWSLSQEETYFFGQFVKGETWFHPVVVEKAPPAAADTPEKFDLIYVASDNRNNMISCEWFFNQVYPLLPATIRICVIGKITAHVPSGLKNVTLVPFAASLSEYYDQSRVVLCPMLAGTGVKVKVIEAMSFGLPVVCNNHGLDGLPNKSSNGCLATENPAEFAAYIQQLLNDPVFYAQQSAFAAACFKNNFSEEIAYRQLDAALGIKPS